MIPSLSEGLILDDCGARETEVWQLNNSTYPLSKEIISSLKDMDISYPEDPYKEDINLSELLAKIGIDGNDNLYWDNWYMLELGSNTPWTTALFIVIGLLIFNVLF